MTQSTVLFDDACGKCSRWAAFIDKRNPGGRLRILGQETDEGRELLEVRPPSLGGVDSVFIITEDGQWYARSTAIWRSAMPRLRFASATACASFPITFASPSTCTSMFTAFVARPSSMSGRSKAAASCNNKFFMNLSQNFLQER